MATHRIQSRTIITTLCSTTTGESLYGFTHPSIKTWNNPGDISLTWNCISVIKSQPPHSEWHQLPIKRKPTTIDLIIYKHSTHKSRHLKRGRSEWKLSNPCGDKRKSWTHLPSSFCLINTRNKKIKSQIHPVLLYSSATPRTKRRTHLLGT